jgi:DNA-directed RNA polymerase specialized sigma subunit
MLNNTATLTTSEISAIVVEHGNLIELAVMGVIENSDHRVWGMLYDLIQTATIKLMEALADFNRSGMIGLARFIRKVVKHCTINVLKTGFEAPRFTSYARNVERVAAPMPCESTANEARLAQALASIEASDRRVMEMLIAGTPAKVVAIACRTSNAGVTRAKQRSIATISAAMAA